MPASKISTLSFTMSAVISPGTPAPRIKISASFILLYCSLCGFVLYYTLYVLHCMLLYKGYSTFSCCTVLYFSVLFFHILFCVVLFLLYCIVLYYTFLYYIGSIYIFMYFELSKISAKRGLLL